MYDPESVWAVVSTYNGIFLGRIVDVFGGSYDFEGLLKSLSLTLPLKLQPAYELHNSLGIAPDGKIMKNIIATHYMHTVHGAPLYIIATGLQLLSEMADADKTRYKKMVEGVEAQVDRMRAQDAGIQLATTMPKHD